MLKTWLIPLIWKKHKLIGVGHDDQLMAKEALLYVLTSLLSLNSVSDKSIIKIYPNPTVDIIYFNNRLKIYRARIYSVSGQLIKTVRFSSHEMNICKITSGIYFIKLNEDLTHNNI